MKVFIALIVSWVALSATATPLQLLSPADASFTPPASGGGDSMLPVISSDGRYVLFASTANNLALTTGNSPFRAPLVTVLNVFLRDRASNTTVLASVNLAGTGGADQNAVPAGISTNGQFLLFESAADNLVSGDTNSASDVFVRDVVNGTTILISVNTNGVCGNGGSYNSTMTPDGRYVAFTSAATDLVAGDTNGIPDVFVRDLQNGTTRLVSVGAQANNAIVSISTSLSDAPAITPDGRYVAFYSLATNLVPAAINSGEVYVRDLVAGTTTWASVGARDLFQSLTGSAYVVSCNLRISDDGNYIAFEACTNKPTATSATGIILRYNAATQLTDLVHTNAYVPLTAFEYIQDLDMTPDGRFIAFVANVTGSAGTNTAIYLWDAQTGTNVLVSANTNNLLPSANFCDAPAISSNGQWVAFFSGSAELATNASGSGPFLYLRNVTAGTTWLVNADTNGVSFGDISMQNIALSPDGQFVAFESVQPNLVANDCNRDYDVFLRNTGTGAAELVSARHPSLPSLTADGQYTFSAQPLSQDGHYLAFASTADDLVAGGTNRSGDVYVCDLYAGTNALVSVGINGTGGSANSYEPAISGNGRYVAFTSAATNLIAGDINQSTDVFVRDLLAQTTSLVSVNSTGTGEGNSDSYSPAISSDGRFVLFVSLANNLAAGTSGYGNLFLRDRQTGVTYALTTTGQTHASMTPDGHFIAFTGSTASSSIYLWDAQLAQSVATKTMTAGIQAISISPDGNRIACLTGYNSVSLLSLSTWDRAANQVYALGTGYPGSHFGLRFSADGRYLTYALSATANGTKQIYLHDFLAQTNVLVSHGAGVSTPADGSSDSPDISADGRFVVYRSAADNIVTGDSNAFPMCFSSMPRPARTPFSAPAPLAMWPPTIARWRRFSAATDTLWFFAVGEPIWRQVILTSPMICSPLPFCMRPSRQITEAISSSTGPRHRTKPLACNTRTT